MAIFFRLVGAQHARQALACILLVAVSSLTAAEPDYIAGLRQSSLLNAGDGLVQGDSQEQLRQLKQAHDQGVKNPEMPVSDCASDPPPCERDTNGISNCVVHLFSGIEKTRLVIVDEEEWIEWFPV